MPALAAISSVFAFCIHICQTLPYRHRWYAAASPVKAPRIFPYYILLTHWYVIQKKLWFPVCWPGPSRLHRRPHHIVTDRYHGFCNSQPHDCADVRADGLLHDKSRSIPLSDNEIRQRYVPHTSAHASALPCKYRLIKFLLMNKTAVITFDQILSALSLLQHFPGIHMIFHGYPRIHTSSSLHILRFQFSTSASFISLI